MPDGLRLIGTSRMMTMLEDELRTLIEQIMEREREIARSLIVREIQAFAGDYGHIIEGRNCVIVEQLVDFLKPVGDSK